MSWQPTLYPARTITRIGRWLLPWTCALIVSASLAHALEQALVRTLAEPPALPTRAASATAEPTAATPDASCDARRGSTQYVGLNVWIPADPQGQPCQASPAQPGSHWVDLEAVALDGSVTHLACLTSADTTSTGVLHVRAEDLVAAVAAWCSDVRH